MKNDVYPYKPQFYHVKLGSKGIKIIEVRFRDVCVNAESKGLDQPTHPCNLTKAFPVP